MKKTRGKGSDDEPSIPLEYAMFLDHLCFLPMHSVGGVDAGSWLRARGAADNNNTSILLTRVFFLLFFFFFFPLPSPVTKLDKKKTTTIFSVPDGERHQLVLKQVTSRGFALRTPQQGVDLL